MCCSAAPRPPHRRWSPSQRSTSRRAACIDPPASPAAAGTCAPRRRRSPADRRAPGHLAPRWLPSPTPASLPGRATCCHRPPLCPRVMAAVGAPCGAGVRAAPAHLRTQVVAARTDLRAIPRCIHAPGSCACEAGQ
ncbi:unnamed protein product [Urochloa humidicola]